MPRLKGCGRRSLSFREKFMPQTVQALRAKVVDVPAENAVVANLTLSPEKAFFIIVKAREFDAKVPPAESDPASNAAGDQEGNILEDYPDDATYAELRDAINGLNDDEKIDLIALLWTGRGDFAPTEWDEAREQARQEMHHAAAYLTGTPLLGDLVEDGLAELGYSVEEYEIGRL
jgi:hypothetical protein